LTVTLAGDAALSVATADSLGLPFNDVGGTIVMIGSATPGDCGALGWTVVDV
jgi:hypothetical protein